MLYEVKVVDGSIYIVFFWEKIDKVDVLCVDVKLK